MLEVLLATPQNPLVELPGRDLVRSGGVNLLHLPVGILLLPGGEGFREDGRRVHMPDYTARGCYQCPCVVVGALRGIELRAEGLNQSAVLSSIPSIPPDKLVGRNRSTFPVFLGNAGARTS